jgi:para-nitrobenzyl esterase
MQRTRLAILSILLAGAAGIAMAASPDAPDMRTAQGMVRGQVRDGVSVFRGIPYAAAPTGRLRFRAPQAPAAWSGVRDATQDGPACPQNQSGDPAGKASTNEDCLLLNVFAPQQQGAGRPVLVWIHGGGFNIGFSGARQYDPTPLVKEGNVVVVSINYRLGTLGLLTAQSLDAGGEPSGNYAIRDQQAALRWVQRNIAGFGGDPRNVTIVGESAGGASVLALVASPLSRGLFHKAIAQSPPNDSHALSRAASQEKGNRLAEALGCKAGAGQADCLRALPVEAILKTRGDLTLVQDPQVLPRDTFEALRDGRFNRVPMIIGSNLQEGYFFVSGGERRLGHPMTPQEYEAEAKTAFGTGAPEVMRQYPVASHPSPAAAIGAAHGDIRFACYADMARMGAAKFVPVYGYEMNEPDPVQQQPRQKISLANTAYHTTDLAYLFDYDTAPLAGDAATLGKSMRAAWIAFARSGSPNGAGLPAWPRFQPNTGAVLNLSRAGGQTNDFAARHNCGPLQKAGLVTWAPK